MGASPKCASVGSPPAARIAWIAPTVFAVGEVAVALNLVETGGTDYHGDFGPYAESHAMLWVPPEVGPRVQAAVEALNRARARP